MNAPVSRLDFLSVLPSFVEDQLQNTKQAIYLLIDWQYGDDITRQGGRGV